MTQARLATGRCAEEHVAEFLSSAGFRTVARNVHLGKLEIDIVAVRGRLLVFCEVRSRRDADERFGSPVDTIGPSKIRKLRRAGARYVAEQRWSGAVRFDAASVVFSPTHPPRIDYFENAFDLLHGGK